MTSYTNNFQEFFFSPSYMYNIHNRLNCFWSESMFFFSFIPHSFGFTFVSKIVHTHTHNDKAFCIFFFCSSVTWMICLHWFSCQLLPKRFLFYVNVFSVHSTENPTPKSKEREARAKAKRKFVCISTAVPNKGIVWLCLVLSGAANVKRY